ncbi:hypothetical protein EXS66_02270 [Candidatus Saccharibacteria bacterium]|nr:hypothetical protein [Candidatus Saccharibacteria bacterium]
MSNVWINAGTRYGTVRVQIPAARWRQANADGTNRTRSRDFIAIKVRARLNSAGAAIYWLNWDEITFGPISSQQEPENPPQPQPSPLALHNAEVAEMAKQAEAMVTDEELDDAARLFPEAFGFTPPSSDFDACGCIPRSVTAM